MIFPMVVMEIECVIMHLHIYISFVCLVYYANTKRSGNHHCKYINIALPATEIHPSLHDKNKIIM